MAPKPKGGAPNAAGLDPVRWVGKAFLAAVKKDPGLYRDVYYLIRERVGNNLAGELVAALHDAGADQFEKPKKEMTDDEKAALVARFQKGKRKKQKEIESTVREIVEPETLEELK